MRYRCEEKNVDDTGLRRHLAIPGDCMRPLFGHDGWQIVECCCRTKVQTFSIGKKQITGSKNYRGACEVKNEGQRVLGLEECSTGGWEDASQRCGMMVQSKRCSFVQASSWECVCGSERTETRVTFFFVEQVLCESCFLVWVLQAFCLFVSHPLNARGLHARAKTTKNICNFRE